MAISLRFEAKSAIGALNALDQKFKQLDSTMKGMKGVPKHLSQNLANVEKEMTRLQKKSGVKTLQGEKGEFTKAQERSGKAGAARKKITELNRSLRLLEASYKQLNDFVKQNTFVEKSSEQQQKESMSAVKQHTDALNEMNKDITQSIKQKRSLGIPLLEEEKRLVTELNARVRLSKKGTADLTDEERRMASALKLTGERLKFNNNVLKKKQSQLEKLRLTVSRTRNITLLYSFAVRPLQNIVNNVSQSFVEYEKSMIGASRVASRFGISQAQLSNTMEEFTSSGMLDITEVSGALKTLVSTGIGLPKARELLMAFSDAAAFNRQGTLELGQALLGATQGFKNMNSRMVDNAGITKNLNIILKEQAARMGVQVKDLTEQEQKMAIANGLIQEAAMFQGDLATATQTTSGAFAKADIEMQKVGRQIGKMAERNGLLFNLAKATQEVGMMFQKVFMTDLEKITDAISRAGVATEKTTERMATITAQKGIMGLKGSAADMATQMSALLPGLDASALGGLNAMASEEELKNQLNELLKLKSTYLSMFKAEQTANAERLTSLKKQAHIIEQTGDPRGGFVTMTSPVNTGAGTQYMSRIEDTRNQAQKDLDSLNQEIGILTKAFNNITENRDEALKLLLDLLSHYERLVGKETELADAQGNTFTADQLKDIAKLEEKLAKLNDQYREPSEFAPAKAFKALEKDLDAVLRILDKFPRDLVEKDAKTLERLRKGFVEIYGIRQGTLNLNTFIGLLEGTDARTGGAQTADQERDEIRRSVNKFYDDRIKKAQEMANLEGQSEYNVLAAQTTVNILRELAQEEINEKLSKLNQGYADDYTKFQRELFKMEEDKVGRIMVLEQKRFDELDLALERGVISQEQYEKDRFDIIMATDKAITEHELSEEEKRARIRNKIHQQRISDILSFSSSMTKMMRGMDAMSQNAARNATAVIASAGRAAAALERFNASGVTGFGKASAIASIAAAGVDLVRTFTDNDQETQERKELERRRRFGATINRGPQTLYLTPTLVVNADGDVHFGDDSLEVIHQRQMTMLQESVDAGEIALPIEEPMR